MKQRYYSLLLIIALIISNMAIAQDDKSDAIFLKLEKEYQLNDDGSFDYREQKQLKLLTYYSFHRLYGESFILFNPLYQKLTINKSFTIMADGRKVQTPGNAYNELLPRFASDAPDHNYLREMVITHTGLEKNAVINLDYSIHTTKDFFPLFKIEERIIQSSIVDELIIKVKIPVNKTAKYILLNSDVVPEIKEEGNMRIFTWTFNSVPADNSYSWNPAKEIYQPYLLFSTANNLDEYVSAIIKQPAFEFQVNAKMRKKVESLKTDSSDDLDLALKIQKYVVNEFKTKYIPSENIGYKYRQANEVWESAYGTKPEKLLLMTALLKIVNLEAKPYAVIYMDLLSDKISIPVIRDYVVRVDTKDGLYFYLYPDRVNSQDAAYELSDKVLILLGYTEGEKIIHERKRNNEIKFEANLKIGKDGHYTGHISSEMTYAVNPYYDLKRNKSKAGKLISGSITGKDCKSNIIESSPEKSIIEYKVQSKYALEKKAGYMFIELPYLKEGIEDLQIHELSSDRTSPIKISYAFNEAYQYNIELEEGMDLVNPKIKIEEKNNAGSVVIGIKGSGNKIKVSRSISFNQNIISPEDYPAFRKLMNLWNDRNYREIVVKNGN